jgi:tetratricopeptide (TPR) repeat protein
MRRVIVLGALLVAASGCASKNKLAQQVEVVKTEEAPDKLMARGRAFASVGDFARAEQYFAMALERGADVHTTLPLLLRVCAEAKRYRAGIDYAEPELRRHPGDYRLRFVVASFYTTIGDVGAARSALEQVIKDKPDMAPAHFALATLLRDEQGDLVEADTHFREYLRLEPAGVHADEARGSLLKLKLVDRSAPITTPPAPPHPLWHDVGLPSNRDKVDEKGKAP